MKVRILFTTVIQLLAILGASAQTYESLRGLGNQLERHLYTQNPYEHQIGFALGPIDSCKEVNNYNDPFNEATIRAVRTGDVVTYVVDDPTVPRQGLVAKQTSYVVTPNATNPSEIDTIERTQITFNVSAPDTSQRTTVRHFSAGRLDSAVTLRSDGSRLSFRKLEYGSNGNLIRSVDSINSGGRVRIDDEIKYEYDSEDRVSLMKSINYARTGIRIDSSTVDIDYLSRDEIRYTHRFIDPFSSTVISDTLTYFIKGGEVDSVEIIQPDERDPEDKKITYMRMDDGSDSRFRKYLLPTSSDFFVEYSFWYTSPISDVQAPVTPGQIVFANPISYGMSIRLSEVLSGTRYEIYSASGALVQGGQVDDGETFSWPSVQDGVYVMVLRANGYSPRAWRVISQ